MQISLHKNARTTPAVRAEIAASSESARVLAQRHGITEQTVYKWKKRDSVHDRSHTAHHLQTQLTPAQEIVVVHLRRALLLPLDDLLAVTRGSFARRSHARAWIGACAAMGWAICMPSSPPSLPRRTRRSKATSLATCTWM